MEVGLGRKGGQERMQYQTKFCSFAILWEVGQLQSHSNQGRGSWGIYISAPELWLRSTSGELNIPRHV